MSIISFFNDLTREIKILLGEGSKDKIYSSQNSFPDRQIAAKEFERSKGKLFDVNRWSDFPGVSSKFELYDNRGNGTEAQKPEVGYFIRILLPSPTPENWVQITHLKEESQVAEFTVNPCRDPLENNEDVEHFFVKEATSTFKVELKNTTIYAYEIGKNERVNNQDNKEAGKRKAINTLLAAGGWAGFQKLQWEKLTKYLVHKIEIEK
jgi:hypothetical protein